MAGCLKSYTLRKGRATTKLSFVLFRCVRCVFVGFGVRDFCSKFPLRSAPDFVSSVVKGV